MFSFVQASRPTCSSKRSDDASLLALASEFEAAARPYLAYDRDGQVTGADPDYAEAMETARRLYGDVKAVADRIFSHQPQSVAGLLVLAHAATLTCGDAWEDDPDHGDQDGRLLRLICNGLFRLAGVDWRGRPLSNPELPSIQGAARSQDAALIPLVDAAIAEERAALAISEATDHDVPPGTFARSMQLLELVTATGARTSAGVAAKARLLLTHAHEEDDLDGDWRCQSLALSIARDATHLDGGQLARSTAPRATDDPVFGAVKAYRDAHAALVIAETTPGKVDEKVIKRNDGAFKALLSVRPTTEAGRLAQLEQVVFEFAYSCTPPENWIEDAGRLVNGGLPVVMTTLSPTAIEPASAQ